MKILLYILFCITADVGHSTLKPAINNLVYKPEELSSYICCYKNNLYIDFYTFHFAVYVNDTGNNVLFCYKYSHINSMNKTILAYYNNRAIEVIKVNKKKCLRYYFPLIACQGTSKIIEYKSHDFVQKALVSIKTSYETCSNEMSLFNKRVIVLVIIIHLCVLMPVAGSQS